MNHSPKTVLAIVISLVVIIAVGTTAVFASKYYKTEQKRAAEALAVAQLERERLAAITPMISTNIFHCDLPENMRAFEYRDAYYGILTADVSATQKAVVAILKKYPGAFEAMHGSNYEYSSQIAGENDTTISFGGKVSASAINGIMSEIEKLPKSGLIIGTKNVSSTSAETVSNTCNSQLINTQTLVIKEAAYLNQLQRENLDPNTLNLLTQELMNIRSQFQSDKIYSFVDVKKTLNEANLNINISLLKG